MSKPKTMLDVYQHYSPDKDGGSKVTSKKNSIAKITKIHNRTETIDDNTDEENFLAEHSKREMNFKPT